MSRKKEIDNLFKRKEQIADRKIFNVYNDLIKQLRKEVKVYADEVADMDEVDIRNRAKKLDTMKKIDRAIKSIAGDTQLEVYDYVKDIAAESYLSVFYDLEGKTKMAIDFNMLDERYIETLINKKIEGRDFAQRVGRNTNKLAKTVQEELLQGAVNGSSYQDIARNIYEQTREGYRASLRIARTEGHRVQTESTQKGYEEAEDLGIEVKKQWVASLDDATRDEHADLDGQVVGIDEEFEIDGYTAMGPGLFGESSLDINCRCSTISIVDGISPKLRRDNLSKEVIEYKNYNEWKKNRVN